MRRKTCGGGLARERVDNFFCGKPVDKSKIFKFLEMAGASTSPRRLSMKIFIFGAIMMFVLWLANHFLKILAKRK